MPKRIYAPRPKRKVVLPLHEKEGPCLRQRPGPLVPTACWIEPIRISAWLLHRYLLGRRLPLTPAFPSAARPLTARDPMRCAYHCLRPSRSLHETRLQARSVRRAFEHVERRDSRVDEVVVGRADRERKGRSDRNGAAGNGRAVHVGSKEDVGGLSPPTDAVYGLAGLYVPASASHYGACIRARPQPASCGVARQNRGCRVCGKSGVTSTHENPRPGMPWITKKRAQK